jgi:hypothetical protein
MQRIRREDLNLSWSPWSCCVDHVDHVGPPSSNCTWCVILELRSKSEIVPVHPTKALAHCMELEASRPSTTCSLEAGRQGHCMRRQSCTTWKPMTEFRWIYSVNASNVWKARHTALDRQSFPGHFISSLVTLIVTLQPKRFGACHGFICDSSLEQLKHSMLSRCDARAVEI